MPGQPGATRPRSAIRAIAPALLHRRHPCRRHGLRGTWAPARRRRAISTPPHGATGAVAGWRKRLSRQRHSRLSCLPGRGPLTIMTGWKAP